MKVNEGNLDRSIRVIVGLGIIIFGLWAQGWTGVSLMVLGLIPFSTGVLGVCPVYSLFGFSTCSLKK